VLLAKYYGDSANASDKLPHHIAILVIVFICIFIASFAWSWGPLGWLVPSCVSPHLLTLPCSSGCKSHLLVSDFALLYEPRQSFLCAPRGNTLQSACCCLSTIFNIRCVVLSCLHITSKPSAYSIWGRHHVPLAPCKTVTDRRPAARREIHPLDTRSAGQSLNVFVNLLFTFVIGQSFLAMLCGMKFGVFLFFAGEHPKH